MSEMVERVHRIIANGYVDGLPAEEIARAVIAAMREPPSSVVAAGACADRLKRIMDPISAARDVWETMIGEALKEGATAAEAAP